MTTSLRAAHFAAHIAARVAVVGVVAAGITQPGCNCDEDIGKLPAPIAVLRFESQGNTQETPPLEHLDVNMGILQISQTTQATLHLDNDGNGLLITDNIILTSDPELCPQPSGAFSIVSPAERVLNIAPSESQDIVVQFAPTVGAEACVVVEVLSNDVEHPSLRAVLRGQGDAPQLCADEPIIDFGEVFIGDTKQHEAVLRSCGTRPITVQSIATNNFFPPFSITTQPATPVTLAPGEEIRIPTAFTPTEERAYTLAANTAGLITLNTDAVGQLYQIALVGNARRPPSCELQAVPSVVQFGTIAAGRTSTQQVLLQNIGDLACDISSVALRNPSSSFTIDASAIPAGTSLAPLATLQMSVTFAPQGANGVENNFIDIASNDPISPTLAVNLEGNSIEPTPCLVEATPSGLNFGNQGLRRTSSRTVTLTNVGTETCLVKAIDLTSGIPDFDVVASLFPLIGTILPSGESLEVETLFKPQTAGQKVGNVRIRYKEAGFGNPDQNIDVPLTGNGTAPCIRTTPSEVDFGNVAVGGQRDQNVRVENCGASDLSLRGTALAAGSHPDFHVLSGPALPADIPPGGSVEVPVRASPTTTGTAQAGAAMYGAMEIYSDEPNVTVDLRANAPQCTQGLVCQPRELVFGDVDVGESLARSLTCRNEGTSSVVVRAQIGAPFQIIRSPARIDAGQTGVITVLFAPNSAGAASGTLTLGANACDGSPINVAVRANGVDNELPVCPTPQSFTPEVVWHWEGGTTQPASNQVWMTPLVSRLEDTNGDNVVTRDDMPRVIIISFSTADAPDLLSGVTPDQATVNDPTPGMLRALAGNTGAEVFNVTNPEYKLNSSVTPIVADIDADGFPEIVAQKWIVLEGVEDFGGGPKIRGKFVRGNLIAFEHDGTFKWQSEEWTRSEDEIEDASGLTAGDMDGDGFVEIAIGDNVFDYQGRLKFKGGRGQGTTGHGPMSVIADVDGLPGLELIAGNTAYRADGSVLWHNDDVRDGHTAVADLDGDGKNEVVIRNNQIHVLNGQTGQERVDPITPPTQMQHGRECVPTQGGGGGGGEEEDCNPIPTNPALIDVDGNGTVEIVSTSTEVMVVLDYNLNELWRSQITDITGASGPIGFDFEDDGKMNVVFSDEQSTQVYDAVGRSIYSAERGSVTMFETAAIADADNDGHANFVVGSNEPQFGFSEGLDVLANTGVRWPKARGFWNQHAYVESLFSELGTPMYYADGMPALPFFRAASGQCE